MAFDHEGLSCLPVFKFDKDPPIIMPWTVNFSRSALSFVFAINHVS